MDANKDKCTNNNENHFGFITLWNWIWNHSFLISFLIGLLLHLTSIDTYSSLCWIFRIVFDFPYMLTGFFKHSYWATLHYFMSRNVAKMYDVNVWCIWWQGNSNCTLKIFSSLPSRGTLLVKRLKHMLNSN
jgi:hypothetical protein